MIQNSESQVQKAGFTWLIKMAWRDAKASKRKLSLFVASIVLGIAAVVSIQSFGDTLKANIAQQSKALMGADFKIKSNKPPNEIILGIIDSIGGAEAQEINFASMVAFPKNESTRLMQVRGLEEAYPIYGQLETEPAAAAADYQTQLAALVDATVMLQFGLEPGDSLKVGNLNLKIAGAIKSIPGSNAIFSSVAPPLILPNALIKETGLIQTGSRIEFEYFFKADPNADLEALEKTLRPILDIQNASISTHTSTSRRLGRRYENFGKFLNLVAFVALLLGCVGIASAIHIYIKEKLRSVAVLKCLGASKFQSFMIYLIQIAFIGFLSGLIGTALGLMLQQLFPLLLQDLLPVDVEMMLSPQVIITGLALGVFMSVLFALYPLMSTLYVSPLQTLRVQENMPKNSRKVGLFVLAAIFLFVFLFAYWLLRNWQYAAAFVFGIITTFSILAGIAEVFMRGIKKYFPSSWGFIARQSLLNLFRPQNQTLILILTIGVASFLISTLYFTKDLLQAQASIEKQSDNANMIMLDIQNGQKSAVINTIQGNDLEVLDDIPIVTMRIHNLAGRSVNDIRQDTTSEVRRWILNHEFRVTYRDSLIASETLEEGNWIHAFEESGIVPISVSDNFARDAMVKLGDQITFNVQGVLLNTEVKSIRAVDWSRAQLNFTIVFPLGVLENAPQFRVLSTNVPDESSSATLQKEMVRDFPNVTIIDIRQILTLIERILEKISWLINFMAFFSILTGIVVLIGAVRTSKFQRIKESVLLRTIGAKSKQILKIIALEYLYLGLLGTASGLLLSIISSFLLAWLVFESPLIPSLLPMLALVVGITIMVVLIGLGNSIGVIKSPPLEVLRKEGR
ncbi:MAG: ABC transporter permease [Cyclobacteriaceae bacterium]